MISSLPTVDREVSSENRSKHAESNQDTDPQLKAKIEAVNDKITEAIMFLSDYGLRCSIPTHGGRLLDTLNDPNSRFLNVNNAKFFRRDDFQSVLTVPETLVIKNAIQLVVIDEPTQNSRKLYYATLEQRTSNVVVSLPTTIVIGTAYPKAARDPHSFLTVEAGGFVPVTNATIHQLTSTASKLESRVALIRTEAISSLFFGEAN